MWLESGPHCEIKIIESGQLSVDRQSMVGPSFWSALPHYANQIMLQCLLPLNCSLLNSLSIRKLKADKLDPVFNYWKVTYSALLCTCLLTFSSHTIIYKKQPGNHHGYRNFALQEKMMMKLWRYGLTVLKHFRAGLSFLLLWSNQITKNLCFPDTVI